MQEQEQASVGIGGAQIVKGGHIEFHFPVYVNGAVILIDLVDQLLDLLAIGVIAAVIHNDQLEGDPGMLLDRFDAAAQDLRIILAGQDDADQPGSRGIRVITSGQRPLDQVGIPGLEFLRGVEKDLRDMADREPALTADRKTAVRLGQLHAELAVDPGTQRFIRLIPSGQLLFDRVSLDGRHGLNILCPAGARIDDRKGDGPDGEDIAEIEG